jgi:dTDP-4-dehydrorhamnose reductase
LNCAFLTAIVEEARAVGVELKVKEVRAITASEYPTPAKRPLNSRLSLEKIGRVLGVKPRPWHEALQGCLASFGSKLR